MGNEIWWVCGVFLEHDQLFCPKLLKIKHFLWGYIIITEDWLFREQFLPRVMNLLSQTYQNLRGKPYWNKSKAKKTKAILPEIFCIYVSVRACVHVGGGGCLLLSTNMHISQQLSVLENSSKVAVLQSLNDSNLLSNSGIALLLLLCTWKKSSFYFPIYIVSPTYDKLLWL